ncbi:hypothetical protein M0R45_007017 [Rubus argutus]|uniref:Zinc finger PMZ-type domain-containing protein n=1 Tax=Rubus argutus TaxID=59490 RepID=A0AAW1YSF3_RUBAR
MQAVDLARRTYTCRKWDISGLPCEHTISAIYVKDQDPIGFVDSCYNQRKYLEAYDPIIHTIAGEDQWPLVLAPMEPLAYRAPPGRPKS